MKLTKNRLRWAKKITDAIIEDAYFPMIQWANHLDSQEMRKRQYHTNCVRDNIYVDADIVTGKQIGRAHV